MTCHHASRYRWVCGTSGGTKVWRFSRLGGHCIEIPTSSLVHSLGKATPGVGYTLENERRHGEDYPPLRLRRARPTPARPVPTKATVTGSGVVFVGVG
jgi:hypothetical protein